MRSAVRYLKKMGREQPHLANWMRFLILYRKKDWDLLELKIMQYIEEADKRARFELYKNFIVNFELKVNPLWLVEYASRIAELWSSPEAVINMIETHFKPKVSHHKLATIYCKVLIGEQFLKMGNKKAVQKILNECSINYLDHDSLVHLRHFKLAMRHYQFLGDQKKLAEIEKKYTESKSPLIYRNQMQHYEFKEFINNLYKRPKWTINE